MSSYHERKAAGLCPKCGGVRDDDRYIACSKCRNHARQYVKESRKFFISLGLCKFCGRNKPIKGLQYCTECQAKKHIYNMRYSEKIKYGKATEDGQGDL